MLRMPSACRILAERLQDKLGQPLMVELGPMPYAVMNTLLDAGFPRGALNYWKSSFVESLDDELIDLAIERAFFVLDTVPFRMSRHLLKVLLEGVSGSAIYHNPRAISVARTLSSPR